MHTLSVGVMTVRAISPKTYWAVAVPVDSFRKERHAWAAVNDTVAAEIAWAAVRQTRSE